MSLISYTMTRTRQASVPKIAIRLSPHIPFTIYFSLIAVIFLIFYIEFILEAWRLK